MLNVPDVKIGVIGSAHVEPSLAAAFEREFRTLGFHSTTW